jgi:ferredoxin
MATFYNSNIATITNMDGLISGMEGGRIVIDLYHVLQMNVECGEGDEGQRQGINIKECLRCTKCSSLCPVHPLVQAGQQHEERDRGDGENVIVHSEGFNGEFLDQGLSRVQLTEKPQSGFRDGFHRHLLVKSMRDSRSIYGDVILAYPPNFAKQGLMQCIQKYYFRNYCSILAQKYYYRNTLYRIKFQI